MAVIGDAVLRVGLRHGFLDLVLIRSGLCVFDRPEGERAVRTGHRAHGVLRLLRHRCAQHRRQREGIALVRHPGTAGQLFSRRQHHGLRIHVINVDKGDSRAGLYCFSGRIVSGDDSAGGMRRAAVLIPHNRRRVLLVIPGKIQLFHRVFRSDGQVGQSHALAVFQGEGEGLVVRRRNLRVAGEHGPHHRLAHLHREAECGTGIRRKAIVRHFNRLCDLQAAGVPLVGEDYVRLASFAVDVIVYDPDLQFFILPVDRNLEVVRAVVIGHPRASGRGMSLAQLVLVDTHVVIDEIGRQLARREDGLRGRPDPVRRAGGQRSAVLGLQPDSIRFRFSRRRPDEVKFHGNRYRLCRPVCLLRCRFRGLRKRRPQRQQHGQSHQHRNHLRQFTHPGVLP